MPDTTTASEVENLFNSFTDEKKESNFKEAIPTDTKQVRFETDPDDNVVEEDEEEIIEVASKYSTKLSAATLNENIYQFNEFDKMTIAYKRVLDPSGKPTDCFTCHCNMNGETHGKDDDALKYHTSNTSLSDHYVVTRLSDLVNTLKGHITITTEENSVKPFMSSWNGITTKQLNLISNEIEKDMFFIYCGMDPDKEFTSNQGTIELYLMNSYNGKSSVYVNYAFSINAQDTDNNTYSMKDFFTLSHNSNRFLHKGTNIEDIVTALANIESDMSDEIDILKAYIPKEKELALIGSKLKSGKKKEFLAAYESMPDNYKNLYYALILLSSKISNNYNVSEHLMLQPIVNKIIEAAHKTTK